MNDNLRILQIEDMAFDAELIQRAIKNDFPNAQFFLAENQEEFDIGMNQFNPHIILTDHNLPVFDSDTVIRRIEKSKTQIPIIIVTGSMRENEEELYKNRVHAIVLKDNLAQLTSHIKRALA